MKIALLVALLGMSGTIYPHTAQVTEIKGNELTLIDCAGRPYTCTTEYNDWMVGDLASLIMSDNGTSETVMDDIVIHAEYAGVPRFFS